MKVLQSEKVVFYLKSNTLLTSPLSTNFESVNQLEDLFYALC